MRWLLECQNAIRWGDNLRVDLFKSKNLGYLVLLATLATLAVGLILFLIDPNINSPFDGIWSAWVTMTHVGFGDVVPISFFGRLLAAGLILFGLVFFSLFTALVSVFLIGRNMDALGEGMRHVEWESGRIQTGEDRILAELARLA
jgi:voltage-gated potassium channel Kch